MNSQFLSLAQETADALQVPLEDVLTVMSYETAGTMDPMKRGPTTKYGQHRGLIQFGEPQAKQHGVDFSSPEAALTSQLGAKGAFVDYMLKHGFEPGRHAGIDIYSTINAGAPGRYGASDAAAGGAPGDVRDKWDNQMHGHRAKARKFMSDGGIPLPEPTLAFAGGKKGGVGSVHGPKAGVGDQDRWGRKRDEKDEYTSFLDASKGAVQDRSRFEGAFGKALGLNEGGARDKLLGHLGIDNNRANQIGAGIARIGPVLGGLI